MNKMNRRVMSFLLVLAMFVSLIPSNVFTVFAADEVTGGDTTGTTEQETAKNEYEANVGKQAVFDWWEKFLLVDDPTRADISDIYGTDTNTAHIDGEHYWYLYEEEFEESSDVDENGNPIYVSTGEPFIDANEIVMKIVDFYYDDANGWYWYKVDSKDLPEKVQNKPWILYRTDVDMELGFEDPYLCIYDADEVIQFVTSETITVIYMRDENDEIVNDDNGNPIVLKTDKLINHYVISGPSALENAKININTIDSYPVSALSYMEDTYSTTFSKGFTVSINKANGTAWTPEDGMVSIRYEMTQFGTDSYTGDVYFGAAFLYIEDSVYSADATERDCDISDVVYTNTALSTLVFEHMPTDFLSLNYKGYYTTEQVNVYNNTLSAYTTITATEFVKVLYSFTQLIYTQVEKEVEKKDEAGNPVVDDNGNPVMETVVETVVDQQIPWYWIECDGQYFLVRQESITFESEEVIDTKFVFKSWVVEVDVYSDPELYPYDYELVDIALFDGVYKVSGSYYDEEYQMLFYRLECCEHFSWPEGYEEYRYVPADLLEETDQGIAHPIVDFTNPAPIFETPAISPFMLRRSTAGAALTNYGLTRAADGSDTGIVLDKKVTSNGNGTYQVQLEAYTTGTVTKTQKEKPLDIVLVLDQSGSMKYCIGCGEANTSVGNGEYHKVDANKVVASGVYYVYRSGGYKRVYYCSDCSKWHEQQSHSNNGRAYVPGDSNNDGDRQFYAQCQSRLDALKDAVTAFVNEVNTKAKGKDGQYGTADDVPHRIAIVGFANYSNHDNYGNSEVFIGGTGYNYNTTAADKYDEALQEMNTVAGYNNVIASKNALDANGATYVDLGIEMANGIFNANPINPDRPQNRVMIVFTDGIPGYSGGFGTGSYGSTGNNATAVANEAIAEAYKTKNTYGATVYTVGVFDGADASNPTTLPSNNNDENKANRYMHLTSSNYLTAQSMTNVGQINPSVNDSQSYYMSASSTEALNSIFKAMSEQIDSESMELGAEAVVKDIISPYFVLPVGADEDDIVVSTMDATYTNGVLGWTTSTISGFDPEITISGKTISVSDFDFKHNFVSENGREEGKEDAEGSFHGRKLIITFTIEPDPDFLGGTGAVTNGAESGVYDGKGEEVGLFDVPAVEVPLKKISTVVDNKYIYLGNTADLTEILNLYVKRNDQQADLKVTVDGINNAYVNLQYTITLDNNTVAVYTIPAGMKWEDGTWEYNKGELLQNYQALVDTDFAVTCVMTDAAAPNNQSPAEGSATVYVYKPTITFKDSEQTYKKPLNPASDFLNSHFVGAVWTHPTQTITPEGTAPTLAFEYSYEPTNAFDNGVMNATKDVPVKVTVTIDGTGTDIVGNDHVTFVHANCDHDGCDFDSKTEQFIVHVIGALTSLTIQKQGWNALDPNQTYLFRVTGTDADGRPINVVVTVHENRSVTIDGLVIGNEYTVTELTDWSWRYAFNSWSVSGATSDDNTRENGAEIKLGETGNVIIFENTREQLQWLDGDAWCDNRFYTVTTASSDDEDEEA